MFGDVRKRSVQKTYYNSSVILGVRRWQSKRIYEHIAATDNKQEETRKISKHCK